MVQGFGTIRGVQREKAQGTRAFAQMFVPMVTLGKQRNHLLT